MKVTIDIYRVAAHGQVVLEKENVQAAREEALRMAKRHSIPLSEPSEKILAVVAKAEGT